MSMKKVFEIDCATLSQMNMALDAGRVTSEELVRHSLRRIKAYDFGGPMLGSVIAVNPGAVEIAMALDLEQRRLGRRRSALHGIPVVIKDNIDTVDMATTGGSILLRGHRPARDANVVAKLRSAGAVILAKNNMSEFAAGDTSSLGGRTRNPHDLTRTSSGSSGGTAVSVAAGYAPIGIGTDTARSVRDPASHAGLVGLKPTRGLLSPAGIIPLAPSFDTAGIIARTAEDVATVLGVMTESYVDDTIQPREHGVSSQCLESPPDDTLIGVRFGLAVQFSGLDAEVDRLISLAAATLRKLGGEIVEVRFPEWILSSKQKLYDIVRRTEFPEHISDYLHECEDFLPKSFIELLALANSKMARGKRGVRRWQIMNRDSSFQAICGYEYRSAINHGLPVFKEVISELFDYYDLNAIVYPTSLLRPQLRTKRRRESLNPCNIASITGFPDLTLPVGRTDDGLPVGMSFLGRAFSDGALLSYANRYQNQTGIPPLPVHTPPMK